MRIYVTEDYASMSRKAAAIIAAQVVSKPDSVLGLATGSTPLSGPAGGLANQTTAEALRRIGAIGGPRCCKRDSFLAIGAAVDLCAARLGVEMDRPDRLVCLFYHRNPECLDTRCPFNPRFGKTTP